MNGPPDKPSVNRTATETGISAHRTVGGASQTDHSWPGQPPMPNFYTPLMNSSFMT